MHKYRKMFITLHWFSPPGNGLSYYELHVTLKALSLNFTHISNQILQNSLYVNLKIGGFNIPLNSVYHADMVFSVKCFKYLFHHLSNGCVTGHQIN